MKHIALCVFSEGRSEVVRQFHPLASVIPDSHRAEYALRHSRSQQIILTLGILILRVYSKVEL